MIGLTGLEIFNFIFNITEENNQSEGNTDNFDELSFAVLKHENEEIVTISDITPKRLQHDIIGPRTIQAYKNKRSGKSGTEFYVILQTGFAQPSFRDFESYLRMLVSSDEEVIQLI